MGRQSVETRVKMVHDLFISVSNYNQVHIVSLTQIVTERGHSNTQHLSFSDAQLRLLSLKFPDQFTSKMTAPSCEKLAPI